VFALSHTNGGGKSSLELCRQKLEESGQVPLATRFDARVTTGARMPAIRKSVAQRAKKKSRRPADRGEDTSGGLARLRANFFARIDSAQLLQALDHLPGVLYFVKDAKSRLMAVSHGSITRLGFKTEGDMIGLTDRDLVVPELANKYLSDDEWVLRHGRPRRNILEMWFNEQGVRDWIITDKYPLRDARGNVVGLLGTIQTLQGRRGMFAHLGPVGKAADYIRDHLGESIRVSAIARHVGFSERQLERLFRRAFGMTIQQFVIQSRIHAAAYELTHSGRTISEIAMIFGFSDQSAFTNQFRDITGMTPRVYRERYVAELTP
jgi:AraC-like DNA-binding protein